MNTPNNKPFTLRLPPELHEPIAAMAQRERRSLHQQVLHLLDLALEGIEDAQDIRDAAARRAAGEQPLPFDQASREIEEQRAAEKV